MIQSRSNIASVPLRFFGKLPIRRNGTWVKSQLYRIVARHEFTFTVTMAHTRVGYNVYELYCPLESIGQFGPSADPAIVATRTTASHQLHRSQRIPSKLTHPVCYFVRKLARRSSEPSRTPPICAFLRAKIFHAVVSLLTRDVRMNLFFAGSHSRESRGR